METLGWQTLLDKVTLHFNNLLSFIEIFYPELTTVTRFLADLAWKLIGQCRGGFFQAMVTVRSEVAMMTDFTLDNHKAQMIWMVLHCHAIVDDFIALIDFGATQ